MLPGVSGLESLAELMRFATSEMLLCSQLLKHGGSCMTRNWLCSSLVLIRLLKKQQQHCVSVWNKPYQTETTLGATWTGKYPRVVFCCVRVLLPRQTVSLGKAEEDHSGSWTEMRREMGLTVCLTVVCVSGLYQLCVSRGLMLLL